MTDYGDAFSQAVAAELRAARARNNVSYARIIEKTGLGQSSIQRYLKGTRSIRMSELADLCRVLGVNVRELFELAEKSVDDR